jgi:membrane protein
MLTNLKQAAYLWYEKDSDSSAAVVAYYSLFAAVPLILLSVTVVSWLYGTDLVVATLYKWGEVFPRELRTLLHAAVLNLKSLSVGWHVPFFGILFFSGMVIVFFNAMASGLQRQWDLPRRRLKGWFRKAYRSVIFTAVFEVYLVTIVAVDYILGGLASIFSGLATVLSALFFLGVTTVLFALAYHILPEEHPSLHSRIVGAFWASLVLALVKFLVTIYLALTPIPGLYGAAGVLFVLLLWSYVFAAVFYFGAAFAWVKDGKIN